VLHSFWKQHDKANSHKPREEIRKKATKKRFSPEKPQDSCINRLSSFQKGGVAVSLHTLSVLTPWQFGFRR
jgi:hypothetical protein